MSELEVVRRELKALRGLVEALRGDHFANADRLHGYRVAKTAPANGQVPAWDSALHLYVPTTVAGGAAQSVPLLDGAEHTDTLAGTVAAGDIITGNATPKWSRLAKGASGLVLKAGASVLAWGSVAFSELTGALSDTQHGSKTQAGGADHSDRITGVSGGLRTTTGPTNLTMGGVADGEYLRRSGTTIIGGTPAGGGGIGRERLWWIDGISGV